MSVQQLASILCSGAPLPAMTSAAAALERLASEAEAGLGPMTQTTMTAALIYVLASPLRACHLPVVRTLRQLLRLYPAAGADLAANSAPLACLFGCFAGWADLHFGLSQFEQARVLAYMPANALEYM